MTIHQNIRKIRLEKGLTQKQVAEACGTVDATIRAYELGKANPKPATVAKIAKALGVSTVELYGADESISIHQLLNDADIVSAIYQSRFGDEIDEDTMYKRRLLVAFDKLNQEGQEEGIKRIEEMALIPTFQLAPTERTEADVIVGLTEEERTEFRWAYASLKEALLEKELMDKNKYHQSEAALANARWSNEKIMEDRKDILIKILIAAVERIKTPDSDD